MPTIQTNKIEGAIRTRRKRDGSIAIDQDWHFRIRADAVDQSREEILHGTSGVPQYGVAYGPFGLQLVAADGARLDEDSLLWDCVYSLSNTVEEGETNNPSSGAPQTGDPTLWIPHVELKFEEYEEVFRQSLPLAEDEKHPDIGGPDEAGYNARKWMNSAWQFYETGFVHRKRVIVREFSQFEKASGVGAVTIDQIEQRDDTLNDRVYLGRPKRTLKLNVTGATLGTYYGYRCWRVDYSLMYKKDDWRLKQLDVGWRYFDPAHPLPDPASPPAWNAIKRKPFVDADGEPVLGALNGRGRPAVNQYDPSIRYHKAFESINFATFLRLT